MRKIAVFVEGQTEQILVREFLICMYQYTNVGIECYSLRSDHLKSVPYHYPDNDEVFRRSQENFYMIIDAGSDNAVVSGISKRNERLYNEGFEKVIGLRDMFCDEYHKRTDNRKIKREVNEFFIAKQDEVKSYIPHSDIVFICFAIMEVEAWFLGLPTLFTKIDPCLTVDYIKKELKLDLSLDPESTHYHPAKEMGRIYRLVGKTYDKHVTDVTSIVNKIDREDYEALINQAAKCFSFKEFAEIVISSPLPG